MFEWDSAKARANRRKHGLSFDLVAPLFDGPTVEFEDDEVEGEDRWRVIGEVAGKVLVCAFTWRDGRRRIISLRRATRSESHAYYHSLT